MNAPRQIAIVSGKGGTGKTTVAASLASLAARAGRRLVLVDADADAPNLHVLFRGSVTERREVGGPPLARILSSGPARGGSWEEVCAFGAISGVEVDPLRCVGCGVCLIAAPPGGVRMEERAAGEIILEEIPSGPFLRARLVPGEAGFGGLVYRLRARAEEIALERGIDLILLDGPPGIGCPATACVSGCDLALVVAEPALSGWHDFLRMCELCAVLRVPVAVCVNRHDISPMLTARIENHCAGMHFLRAGRIPMDEHAMQALDAAAALVQAHPDAPAARAIAAVAEALGLLGGDDRGGAPAAAADRAS
ncbi:MAG: P-loop NTPase [bacterium]|nr:P-loop NTPase [bacterium]